MIKCTSTLRTNFWQQAHRGETLKRPHLRSSKSDKWTLHLPKYPWEVHFKDQSQLSMRSNIRLVPLKPPILNSLNPLNNSHATLLPTCSTLLIPPSQQVNKASFLMTFSWMTPHQFPCSNKDRTGMWIMTSSTWVWCSTAATMRRKMMKITRWKRIWGRISRCIRMMRSLIKGRSLWCLSLRWTTW